MYFLRQKEVVINLVVMTYQWSAVSFCYYMIAYQMNDLPGNIYNNALASSASEFLAYILGGVLYKALNIKKSFILLYSISVVGSLLILFYGASKPSYMPAFVTLAKFGISACFNVIYIASVDVFPILFCGTALGVCNFAARLLTIFAPLVAQIEGDLPMIIFTVLAGFGLILALGII